jgi:hypothetical protein
LVKKTKATSSPKKFGLEKDDKNTYAGRPLPKQIQKAKDLNKADFKVRTMKHPNLSADSLKIYTKLKPKLVSAYQKSLESLTVDGKAFDKSIHGRGGATDNIYGFRDSVVDEAEKAGAEYTQAVKIGTAAWKEFGESFIEKFLAKKKKLGIKKSTDTVDPWEKNSRAGAFLKKYTPVFPNQK